MSPGFTGQSPESPPKGPDDGAIYFFADTHLTSDRSPEARARWSRIDGFLAHVLENAAHLYILGDLFDFWFEYRHAVPAGHHELFRRLLEIRAAGIPITFLAGNHDFWCMDFLARELGVETHAGPVGVTHQGRKIWLAHGDGLIRSDWGYRALRRVLRHPFCIALYRLVHPDLGVPLAHRSSSGSRHVTEQRDLHLPEYRREVVEPRFAEGYDAVLMGHIHVPTHETDANGNDFFFVGDWFRAFTYVVLENGTFTQRRWDEM